MTRIILTACLVLSVAIPAAAADGVISVPSALSVGETANRLVHILGKKGMTIFDQIHHRENTAKVGIEPGDTELIPSEQENKDLVGSIPERPETSVECHDSVAIAMVGHHDCGGDPAPESVQIRHIENIETIWVGKRQDPGIAVDRPA